MQKPLVMPARQILNPNSRPVVRDDKETLWQLAQIVTSKDVTLNDQLEIAPPSREAHSPVQSRKGLEREELARTWRWPRPRAAVAALEHAHAAVRDATVVDAAVLSAAALAALRAAAARRGPSTRTSPRSPKKSTIWKGECGAQKVRGASEEGARRRRAAPRAAAIVW